MLKHLAAFGPLREWSLTGQKRFPQNAFLVVSEAWSYMAPKGRNRTPWAALEPLKRGQALAEAIPDAGTRRRLFALIVPLMEELRPAAELAAGPLASIIEQVFGRIDPDDFDMGSFDPDEDRPRRRRR
jgi:hypothetical protein